MLRIGDLSSRLMNAVQLSAVSVAAIEKQQNAQVYDSFSYDYNLLKPFTEKQKSTHKCENPDALSGSFRFSKKNVQHSVRMLSSSERPKTVRKVDRSLSGI